MTLRSRIPAVCSASALALGPGLGAVAPASALSDETADFLGALTASYNDPVESANDGIPTTSTS